MTITGINRNILECKGEKFLIFKKQDLSINRNILECKDIHKNQKKHRKNVLIETYWNVKADRTGLSPAFWRVLIETYWNVKGYHHPSDSDQ